MSTAIGADVAVVGAGPAGMAAALAAADLGCRVILVDASAAMGGQIYRPPAPAGATDRAHAGISAMPRRLRRAASHPGIHHLPGTAVWHATAPDPAPATARDRGAGGDRGIGGGGWDQRGGWDRLSRIRALAGRRGGPHPGRERRP